jgi:hypothetical protein
VKIRDVGESHTGLELNCQPGSRPVNRTNIQETLAPLVGLPLRCIGRAADLLWVQFGNLRELANIRGGTRTVGDWALHVQCPWRITQPPTILVARGDCYYEASSGEPYDWATAGESRFDRYALSLNKEFKFSPPLVKAVDVDVVGGFSLRFNSAYIFEVFPDKSSDSDSEHWRLFQPAVSRAISYFQKIIFGISTRQVLDEKP